MDTEWCADPLDMATKITENENRQRIQEQLDRAKCSEQPDEDETVRGIVSTVPRSLIRAG
jgi:hypothetical protein